MRMPRCDALAAAASACARLRARARVPARPAAGAGATDGAERLACTEPPMSDQRARVDVAELLARGFTVVRGFVDAETCRRARAVIDATLGPPGDKLQPGRAPSEAIRSIAHPDSALAVIAPFMPKLVDANAQVLRSSSEYIRLNGQTLVRTDASAGGAPGSPSSVVHWHVDNAFMDSHMDSTPREVYSRSMVTLSDVRSGGGAIMVVPNSVSSTRAIVRDLVTKQGRGAYHGANWRGEIAERLTAETEHGRATALRVQKGAMAEEVLTNAGDLIIFDPMCMHTASRCTNGPSRCKSQGSYATDLRGCYCHSFQIR